MPTANITTRSAMATTALTASFIFLMPFWTRPKIMATTINNREMVAAAAPLKFFVTFPAASAVKPLKVLETIEVNAAITSNVNNQQKSENTLRPAFPMYCSMTSPMDLPSFFTDA